MASKLGIVNMALGFLSEAPLTNLTEGNKLTKTAEIYYDTARDSALRQHPWNFASARAQLSRLAETPAFEFGYYYQLPNDCLRVLYTEDDVLTRNGAGERWPYKVEGKKLATDLDDVKIKYIKQVTEEGNFDPDFSIAFAMYLAYLMSMSLTEHRGQTDDLLIQFKDKLSGARHIESQEGTPEPPIEGGWLASRA